MKTDVNGCSTAIIGQENFETFTYRGRTLFQYDYRLQTGQLFSCVRDSLDKCRAALVEWMDKNNL